MAPLHILGWGDVVPDFLSLAMLLRNIDIWRIGCPVVVFIEYLSSGVLVFEFLLVEEGDFYNTGLLHNALQLIVTGALQKISFITKYFKSKTAIK